MANIWSMVDRGLWTSPIGSVIREHDGWHYFRGKRQGGEISEGPFNTLDAAKSWAERNAAKAGVKAS